MFRGRLLDVFVDTLERPDGSRTAREIVAHPGAAAIVPVLPDGKVLLVRQYRHAVGSDLWEIPAGKLEPGEDPLACAQRELQEETGYAAETWTRVLSFYTSPGFSDERIVLFRASRLRPVAAIDDGEIAERYARSIDEIERMIRASEITDAKTILAVSWLFGRTKETPDAPPTPPP